MPGRGPVGWVTTMWVRGSDQTGLPVVESLAPDHPARLFPVGGDGQAFARLSMLDFPKCRGSEIAKWLPLYMWSLEIRRAPSLGPEMC